MIVPCIEIAMVTRGSSIGDTNSLARGKFENEDSPPDHLACNMPVGDGLPARPQPREREADDHSGY